MFGLSIFSISNSPTCFFRSLFQELNCFHNSADKSSLSNILLSVITSRIMSLDLSSLIELVKSQIKIKNTDVLSLSVKFWYK